MELVQIYLTFLFKSKLLAGLVAQSVISATDTLGYRYVRGLSAIGVGLTPKRLSSRPNSHHWGPCNTEQGLT